MLFVFYTCVACKRTTLRSREVQLIKRKTGPFVSRLICNEKEKEKNISRKIRNIKNGNKTLHNNNTTV